jgi:hypothetical protein
VADRAALEGQAVEHETRHVTTRRIIRTQWHGRDVEGDLAATRRGRENVAPARQLLLQAATDDVRDVVLEHVRGVATAHVLQRVPDHVEHVGINATGQEGGAAAIVGEHDGVGEQRDELVQRHHHRIAH